MVRALALAALCVLATSQIVIGRADEPGTTLLAPNNDVYYSLIRTESGEAPPRGWTRLAVPSAYASVPKDGFFADAFFSNDTRQIVIAFRRLNPVPFWNEGTYDVDAAILHGESPRNYEADLRSFLQAVTAAAEEQTPPLSMAPDNVFVTGNSLGAYAAQLAAKERHYGGVGFAGPGLPGYHAPPERPTNFVNYLIDGDPVANYAADTGISWSGWLDAGRLGDHYGRIERLGNARNQAALQAEESLAVAAPTMSLAAPASLVPVHLIVRAGGYFGLAIEIGLFHLSPRYQKALHIQTLPTDR